MEHAVFAPPPALLCDIRIPDRAAIKTVGDMARIILADRAAMENKNADLAALREYAKALEDLKK